LALLINVSLLALMLLLLWSIQMLSGSITLTYICVQLLPLKQFPIVRLGF
jgi:hypothetical protein